MKVGDLVKHRHMTTGKALGVVVMRQPATVYLQEIVFILWHGNKESEREFPHMLQLINNEVR
jgi:hypothetical protein|tara:strand:- start:127 stop:312 length:186 start_codon:yes stop_codon:yes gene_type:complete